MRIYGSNIHFWTKSQLVLNDHDYFGNPENGLSYDCFPQPVPYAYLDISLEDYLIQVWRDNLPFFVYRNRIKYDIEYVYEDTWKDDVGSLSPRVLLVCDSPILQQLVQRFLKRMADEIDCNELRFFYES